jgi:solute carrier family 35 (UDP-galactose transporter), member B1
MLCGLISTLATSTGIEALLYLPYAVQVVGKSAKPIPVIILGKLIGKKSYGIQRYIFVFIMVIGISLAVFKFEKNHDKKKETNNDELEYIKGSVLIVFSLVMDGLLGAVEVSIYSGRNEHFKTVLLYYFL